MYDTIFLNRYKTLPNNLLLISAIGFFAYTCLRAHLLSMTHDESGSFYIWTHFNIFSCFIDPDCWKTANLHFLYVFLMKGTVSLFGVSELSIRMPSLIGHLIYLYFSWRLVKMWTDGAWLQLCGFFIINCNPFLLEFFALGRGYGLANAFVMVSIFYTGCYFKTKKKRAAWGIFFSILLAVLSNFTSLNFYACSIGAMGLIFLFLLFKKEYIDWKFWKYLMMVGLVISVILFGLIYMPITSLSGAGEFEYGAKAFWDTFSSSVKSSLYGLKYMGSNHVEILGGGYVFILMVGLVIAMRNFLKEPNRGQFQFVLIVSLLPVLVSLSSIIQYYLLGVNYLQGRTVLVFIPLTTIALFFFFENLLGRENKKWKTLPILIGLFCLVHVFRSYQLNHTYEWKYDARTKDMVDYMESIVLKNKQVKLGMNWYYHPTARFYYNEKQYDFTETLNYEKKYRNDAFYDYYYINIGDEKKINPRYKVLKEFDESGVLMVRDSL